MQSADWHNPPPARRTVYYWLFFLIVISGPWFIARFHSAISLTDIFLIIVFLYLLMHRSDAWGFFINARPMWLVGGMFAASVTYSLAIPLWIGSEISSWRAAVTISQYGCIFFVFPLLAGALRSSMTSQTFIRLVALAYLSPLLVQLMYTVGEACTDCTLQSDPFFSAGRALLSYGNANSAAIVISISLPFFLTLFLTETVRRWRAVGLLGIVTSFSCLLLTGSTSGILCFVGSYVATVLAFLIVKPRRAIFLRAAVASVLGIAAVIGAIQFIVHTRSTSDQLRYRMDFASQQMEPVFLRLGLLKSGQRPKLSPPAKLEPLSTEAPDARIPSANLRLEFMWESLESVRRHLYGVYGEGIGQAQALRGERITHLAYLLLLEEGGWPLLLSYLALVASLYRNLWRSAEPIEYKLCLAVALTSLALGGVFQTHMYLRFYWIPLLFAFASPRRCRDAVKHEEAEQSLRPNFKLASTSFLANVGSRSDEARSQIVEN
ncbi:hypothetical protein V1291_003616 [Nitrobacteraceae bacterium AZCC 1564]